MLSHVLQWPSSHGRFRVERLAEGLTLFHDRLAGRQRKLNLQEAIDPIDLFRKGFLDATLKPIRPVSSSPRTAADSLFWQFPARTEQAAWEQHIHMPEAKRVGNDVHAYLGFPWATYVDLTDRHGVEPLDAERELFMLTVRIRGFSRALADSEGDCVFIPFASMSTGNDYSRYGAS